MSHYTGAVPDTQRATNWRDFAACAGVDPRVFYPEGHYARDQVHEARAICNTCPVQTECASWAIQTGEYWGVWGGMSQDQLRKRRRRFTNRTKTSTREAA